ncbi:DUF6415 family natural product biosynthesis protein [Streptomyces sp. G35A]
MLYRLRGWTAFDGDAVLDDVAAALDDVPPVEEDTVGIAEQLCGHLKRLVTIAVAAEAEEDTATAQLIAQARTLHAKDVPGDYQRAVGHVRRLGWTASELFDRLVAVRCLKDAG